MIRSRIVQLSYNFGGTLAPRRHKNETNIHRKDSLRKRATHVHTCVMQCLHVNGHTHTSQCSSGLIVHASVRRIFKEQSLQFVRFDINRRKNIPVILHYRRVKVSINGWIGRLSSPNALDHPSPFSLYRVNNWSCRTERWTDIKNSRSSNSMSESHPSRVCMCV